MSQRNKSEIPVEIAAVVRRIPFLSEFQAPLPRLAEPGAGNLNASFVRLAELVGSPPEPLAVRFQIVEGEQTRTWVLDAGRDGCRVTETASRPPDAEAILTAETWSQIAAGELSLLEAFGRGRMRVRGDLGAARRFVRQLRSAATTPS